MKLRPQLQHFHRANQIRTHSTLLPTMYRNQRRPQFVRGEDLTFFADGTNLTVADPISRIPPHRGVMLLDFVDQIRDARHQFEMLGSEVL